MSGYSIFSQNRLLLPWPLTSQGQIGFRIKSWGLKQFGHILAEIWLRVMLSQTNKHINQSDNMISLAHVRKSRNGCNWVTKMEHHASFKKYIWAHISWRLSWFSPVHRLRQGALFGLLLPACCPYFLYNPPPARLHLCVLRRTLPLWHMFVLFAASDVPCMHMDSVWSNRNETFQGSFVCPGQSTTVFFFFGGQTGLNAAMFAYFPPQMTKGNICLTLRPWS